MPRIHYIWWGDPADDLALTRKATGTPNVVANTLPEEDFEVHYWRWNRGFRLTDDPSERLAPRIVQHELEPWHPIDELVEGTRFAEQRETLDQILWSLTQYQAYSAVKDLLSLIILYKEGGFYFDTTTMVGLGYRPHLARLLREHAERGGPARVVLMPARSPNAVIDGFPPEDRRAVVTALGLVEAEGEKVLIRSIDVWAMYAPAGDEIIARMLDEYIVRAQNLGFTEYPARAAIIGTEVTHDFMAEDRDDQGKTPNRNRIIGSLIGWSVLSALHHAMTTYQQPIEAFGWEAVIIGAPFNAPKGDMGDPKAREALEEAGLFNGIHGALLNVPILAIQKMHGASWRDAVVTTT